MSGSTDALQASPPDASMGVAPVDTVPGIATEVAVAIRTASSTLGGRPDGAAWCLTSPKWPCAATCFECGDPIGPREVRARRGSKRNRVCHVRCTGVDMSVLQTLEGWELLPHEQQQAVAMDGLARDTLDHVCADAPLLPGSVGPAPLMPLAERLEALDDVSWALVLEPVATIKLVPPQCRPALARLRGSVAQRIEDATTDDH